MGIKRFIDSIAFRISISIAVVISVSIIVVGWLILREEKKTLENELKSKGRYLAELMSHSVVEPLLYEERHAIFSLLHGAMKSEDSLIVYSEVFDKNRELIVTAYKDDKYRSMILPPYHFEGLTEDMDISEDSALTMYYISLPVNAGNLGTIGFLRLSITKELLYETLATVKQKLYLMAAAVTLIGIMLGLWMARKVLKPVLILNEGVKMVGEGEVGVEVPVVGHGEIRELSLSFNKMSKKLKELIDTIKSAQEHLVRTEKLYAIGEFSAGIAHEIKNPLTPIKMLMHTARQKNKALSSEDMDIIMEEIDRIDHIVKEFLAFARPEKNEMTEVNVHDVLMEVITLIKPKMEQSAIQLVKKFEPCPQLIAGNHNALKQVFLNLVLNAIQAMDGNGGQLTVKMSADNGNLVIEIIDTGVGIPQEYMSRIFDPFFTTKKEGTGMGLALAYNIINDHSGKINIDAAEGAGTTVKVELPV